MKKKIISIILAASTMASVVLTTNVTIAKAVQLNGWTNNAGNWSYYSNGAKNTGWIKVASKWYYLDNKGIMKANWQAINGQWYYMDASGAMTTGWQAINGQWYYMDNSGIMKTGWQVVNGQWYYMNNSGAMLTGWQFINEKWYYMNNSGAMVNHGTIDGWSITDSGVATISCQQAINILKNRLGNKATYIEYDHMEKGKNNQYDYYRIYASDKQRNKNNESILDFYSVNKYTEAISQG